MRRWSLLALALCTLHTGCVSASREDLTHVESLLEWARLFRWPTADHLAVGVLLVKPGCDGCDELQRNWATATDVALDTTMLLSRVDVSLPGLEQLRDLMTTYDGGAGYAILVVKPGAKPEKHDAEDYSEEAFLRFVRAHSAPNIVRLRDAAGVQKMRGEAMAAPPVDDDGDSKEPTKYRVVCAPQSFEDLRTIEQVACLDHATERTYIMPLSSCFQIHFLLKLATYSNFNFLTSNVCKLNVG